MKLCINCKWYSTEGYSKLCRSPRNGINPTDGSVQEESAVINRRSYGPRIFGVTKCGPDAKYFEQSALQKSAVR